MKYIVKAQAEGTTIHCGDNMSAFTENEKTEITVKQILELTCTNRSPFKNEEQRDESIFKVKKPKFNPKTLKPFDKVLVIDSDSNWTPAFFTYLEKASYCPRMVCQDMVRKVIPYNDETKYLVGTSNEAPEYYRYWED